LRAVVFVTRKFVYVVSFFYLSPNESKSEPARSSPNIRSEALLRTSIQCADTERSPSAPQLEDLKHKLLVIL
jgi:hypothetical protein